MDLQRAAGQGEAKAHSKTHRGAFGAFASPWPAARCQSAQVGAHANYFFLRQDANYSLPIIIVEFDEVIQNLAKSVASEMASTPACALVRADSARF